MKAGSTIRFFNALREKNCALCVADRDGELNVPFVSTADWGYVRLRKERYTAAEMEKWSTRIHGEDWGDCFVSFKYEDEAGGPKMAMRFAGLSQGRDD